MKIRLKRSLPDYPAGTVFELNTLMDRWEFNNRDNYVVGGGDVDDWLHDYQNHPDWFERIDETPLYWEPEEDGDRYVFVAEDGNTQKEVFSSDRVDFNRISVGNAFPTQEAAQAHVDYLKALTRVRKYIQEQGFELVECGEDKDKDVVSEILYSHFNKRIGFTTYSGIDSENRILRQQDTRLPLFKDMDDANQVINNCTDDLKTIFGVES